MDLHYDTFEQIEQIPNFWAELIAPYLANKSFVSAKQAIYPSVRDIPQEVLEFETTLPTVIVQDVQSNEYSRIYLWYGTKNHARSANVLGKNSGKYAFIQTKIPHDTEYYDRYEIMKETDPRYNGTFARQRVNRILATSDEDVIQENDSVIIDVIQKGILEFVRILLHEIDSNRTRLCAVYTSSRIMKRGATTIFRDLDVLLGHHDLIRGLAEESSSGSESESDSESDSDSCDSIESLEYLYTPGAGAGAGAGAANIRDEKSIIEDIIRNMVSSRPTTHENHECSTCNSDSDESTNESYDSLEDKIDDAIMIHNELVHLISSTSEPWKENPRILELINQMVNIGHIDYLDGSDSDSDDAASEKSIAESAAKVEEELPDDFVTATELD